MEVTMEEEGEKGFPYWRPIRRRFGPDSSFCAPGNIERELLAKQVALDLTDGERHRLVNEGARSDQLVGPVVLRLIMKGDNAIDLSSEVLCPIAGCGARLMSLESFEDHYNARHAASCSVCSRVYPTSRLLSIHVSEAHDSFFQAKVARGYPMYECLVEGCDLKFKTYKARQQHLLDKHKFPASFEFLKKGHPSKKARQKQYRKPAVSSEEDAGKMEVEDETINGLVSAVSKLSTSDSSPSSISFGRRRTRGLAFVPRAVQREKRPESTPTTRTNN